MKNFRYKKYVPNELGKIIFFEDLIPKKVLKQQFFSNLFTLFFSIFGLVICILMFSHFIISNDLFGLFFALLFSPFFFYLYKSILNFFIIEIGIVCDKGIMILHLRSDDKLVKNRTLYFDTRYKIKIQERRNFHLAGRYKYTYDKICTFFDKNKKVFQINYSFVDDKKSYKKEFFDNSVLAFETFRITRKVNLAYSKSLEDIEKGNFKIQNAKEHIEEIRGEL
jgi:hypothetical protein